MAARHVQIGKPVHDKERQGIAALVGCLPSTYVVYSNLDVPSGQRGQTYEHDAIVVAPHGVFTVELKSWGGTITGNRDRFTLADGHMMPSPIPLTLSKARALKGQLSAWRRDLSNVWVQGLVFLTAGDAVAHISPDFSTYVVTLRNVQKALTQPDGQSAGAHLTHGQIESVKQWLEDRTHTPAAHRVRALADFELKQRLASDGRPYEAWLATARMTGRACVLHVYPLDGDDAADRERSKTLALREATLHERVRGGPDIFGYRTYHRADDPPRVALEFDDTTPLVPADLWIRERNPGLVSRLVVLRRAAASLAYVHSKSLVHRRLSPDAILVSADSDPPAIVRLGALDLARDLTGYAPTLTGASSYSGSETAARCVAPEALRQGEVSPAGDLFALGATAFALLTGRALFGTPEAVLQPFSVPPLCMGERPVPREVQALVEALLATVPAERPVSAEAVAMTLDGILVRLQQPPRAEELVTGTVLRDTYELVRRLGRGATATTWLARHLQSPIELVLKVAPSQSIELLRNEHAALHDVAHPNIVRCFNLELWRDMALLVLEHVDGATITTWLGAGDPLTAERFLRIADELTGALEGLHSKGWLHRDVKPDNVMLTFADDPRTVLLDLGLAVRIGSDPAALSVGTVRYKDPLVYVESAWSAANDQYAAFLTLYELLTGVHAFGTSTPDAGLPAVIEPELFPEDLGREGAARLAAVFRRALSTHRDARPATLADARRDLRVALSGAAPESLVAAPVRTSRPPRPVAPPEFEPPVVPEGLSPDANPDVLPLSARGRGALARLRIETLGQLGAAEAAIFRSLPNVGRKTRTELEHWQRALAECFELTQAEPSATVVSEPAFYPPLVNSPHPISALAQLTPDVAARLADMGVRTIGDLAALPESVLRALPHMTAERVVNARRELARLADRADLDVSLDGRSATFKKDLGAAFTAMNLALGLEDGQQPLDSAALEDRLRVNGGLAGDRIAADLDLRPLREPDGAGQPFLRLAEALLGPVGVMSLDRFAQALEARAQVGAAGGTRASALGYARLTALLLESDRVVASADTVTHVLRAPWTPASLAAALGVIGSIASWPPTTRRGAEERLWDALDDAHEDALIRHGADAASLLDALLPLTADVRIDPFGGLYTPPVPLADALAYLRSVSQPADAATLVAEAERTFVAVPFETARIPEALISAGYIAVGSHWQDPQRFPPPAPAPEPIVDAGISRQRLGPTATLIADLAAHAKTGGFRVVALAPGEAHQLGPALAESLSAQLGAERVSFLDVDRLLVDALKSSPMWDLIPYYEAAPEPDWRVVHAEARAALEAALRVAVPGHVTVLGNPALLGALSLMDWLGGLYDRARGGRYGLVVLAMPGGIHEGRVRLNERFTLAHTPDMAAVYLEAAGGSK